MAHEPELIPNFTIWIQLAIFMASYWVMKKFLFGPYLALIETRQEKTTGLKENALKQKEKAEKFHADYDVFMKSERKRISDWVEGERKKISDQQREIIQEARMVAGDELRKLREQIQNEFEKAKQELMPALSEYSSEIASKLVGHKVNVSDAKLRKSSGLEPSVVRG